ncbi:MULTISPECIES: hypothetical protein [unclassified Sphingobium]|uniref:hypothetical protein n=1 Tax=unclassified Sphingobium TaxID=2611147 RepID=UPI00222476B1|nr:MULTISPECIES: hypothetical protein [unclassified Sphingobium]MCW2391841.1 hypothetical protein [Sphingobium sp. B11D3A]
MTIWRSCLGLALLITPTVAIAQAPNAQTRGITYACDTAPGHFSELTFPVPEGSVTVSGKMKLLNIAKDSKWAPLARVHFMAASPPGQSSGDQAGFILKALLASKVGLKTRDRNAVVQYLQWDEFHGGQEVEHQLFGIAEDAPVYDFSLTFDGQSVVGTIAGEETRIAFAVPDPVVRIVCSTGEFLFTDLKITSAR